MAREEVRVFHVFMAYCQADYIGKIGYSDTLIQVRQKVN